MERRGADGQGTVGKTYSLHTHKTTLSLKTLSLCRDAVCECVRALVRAPALLVFSPPPLRLFPFHTHANTCTLSLLLEDANIAHDKAPVDSSQTKHFLSKAVHLYAEPIRNDWQSKVSWKAGFSPALSHSRRLFALTSLVWPLITLMFEDIRSVINCSLWYWIEHTVCLDKSVTEQYHMSVVFICREMGARPGHRPWRGRCWNPTEPGNPTWTILEVSYDCASSNLHQVQPVSVTQCTAGGLRTQEHTAYTHSGNGGSCWSMLFTQMGLFAEAPQ